MPLIIGSALGSVLFALGAPLAVVNFAVFTLGAVVFNAALSVGLSLLAGALLQRGQTNTPTPSDVQQELKQALSPRLRSYGRVRVAGPLWWFAAVGSTLYKGAAVNHGLIGGNSTFSIDDNEVDLDVNDKVTSTPYSTGNVFIHSRQGQPLETKYTELLTAFGVDEMRGDGVATWLAVIENPASAAAYQNMFPSGQPLIRETFDASVVYDPRDLAQVRTSPSTWVYTDNAVVCLLDYLASPDGYGIPWEDIERNLPAIMDEMDKCDELIPLQGGGYGKRYRVSGTYRFTDDPRDVVAKFESCCDGRVWVKRDGSIGIVVGKFPEDVNELPHISDAHVTGYTDWLRGQDPLRSIEGVRGEYVSPDHGYREHEAEPYPTGAVVAALTDDRTVTMDLLWVPSNSQARRLMKRAYTRAKAPWRGTVHTNAAGLRALDERFVRLTITELNIVEQTFEVVGFRFNPEEALRCELDVLAVDAGIDSWDPSEEGTAEASMMDFVSSFSKTGTAVDPLTEAGGEVGQYALVFASNVTGFPATPAGWATPAAPTTALGLGVAVYGKKLDGTEGSVTFNSASGALTVVLLRGVIAAQFALGAVAVAAVPNDTNREWASQARPFAVVAFGAANTDFDEPTWLNLWETATKTGIEEHSAIHRTGALTSHVEFAIYQTEEVPPATFFGSFNTDRGIQGLVTFNLSPGG